MAAVICLLLALAGVAPAATVVEGGVEDTGTFGLPVVLPEVGIAVPPDPAGAPWAAAPGGDVLSEPAPVSQVVGGRVVDRARELGFFMPDTSDGTPGIRFLTAGPGGPDWAQYTQQIIAEAEEITDDVTGNDPGPGTTPPFGPAPDDVPIAAVPLPAAVWMLLAGLGALALLRRRRGAGPVPV